MKKVLVVLLALAVAGGVFALDLGNGLSLNGEAVTGINVFTKDDGNDDTDDTNAKLWHDDGGPARFTLDAIYTQDIGGVQGRLRTQGTVLNGDSKVYGWVNLFNNLVTVSAGQIINAAWGDAPALIDTNLDALIGARLEFKVLEGLSFGASLPFVLDGDPAAPWAIDLPFTNATIGAKYASDIFTVSAALGLNDNGADDKNAGQELLLGVIVPVGPVTAELSAYAGFGDVQSLDVSLNGKIPGYRVVPKVSFGVGPIAAYVKADIRAPKDDDYIIAGAKEPGDARFGVEAEGRFKFSDITSIYARLGSDNAAWFAGHGLYIRPGVAFAFSPNASIELWDHLNGIGADDAAATPGDPSGTPPTPATEKHGNISNTVQINFKWTF